MFVDHSIDPTAGQVRALRDAGPEGPITMVNLLKFRDRARYEDGEEAPCTGRILLILLSAIGDGLMGLLLLFLFRMSKQKIPGNIFIK